MEPETGFPFYKPQRGRLNRIMIHEGGKAARFAEEIATNPLSDHPWREELARWKHWGGLGGAQMAHKINWNDLRAASPEDVVYVCDNDKDGRQTLPNVSRLWGRRLYGVVLPKAWPSGWDMADPIPPEVFIRGATPARRLKACTFPRHGRRVRSRPGSTGARRS